jgi:hypothetical protein
MSRLTLRRSRPLFALLLSACTAQADVLGDSSYIVWGPLPNSLLLFGLLGLAAAVAALAVQMVRRSQ